MFTTELDIDRPIDDRTDDPIDGAVVAPPKYRRDFYLTVVVTIFTMAEVWAVLVMLATVHPTGPTGVAMWVALGGSIVAVLLCWRHVLRHDRQYIRI